MKLSQNVLKGILFVVSSILLVADDFRVTGETLPNGVSPGNMVHVWMKDKLISGYEDWQETFLILQKEGGWEDHNRELRRNLIESIGGLPDRTPLNPQVTGVLHRPGFRVEKILFESRPDFFVSASLYLPDNDKFNAPYPGVLIPCGHAREAKAHDEYQSMGALLALNGFVGLVFDPLDQSERQQYRREDGSMPYYGTHMHMQEGVMAMLLGQGLIQYFAWDGIRALDYLVSRPEVDASRLGISGNSGGGTQTSYIFALDERLKVAAPSCWVHLVNRQVNDSMGDWEQMNYGQLSMGLEQPSLYMIRAPAPVKLLASTHDFFQIDAVWESFRWIKRYYTDLGFSERADILENNAGHNYDRTQREAAVRWMNQWLNGRVETILEPELDLFTEEELWATPSGQVLDLEGARSIFDIFKDTLDSVRQERDERWTAMGGSQKRNIVREVVQVRRLKDIPAPVVHDKVTVTRGPSIIHKKLLETEDGLYLPLLDVRPPQQNGEIPLLFVSSEGAAASYTSGSIPGQAALSARRVIAVDPRGVGETQQNTQTTQGAFFGTDQEDVAAAYVLGESYLGMRVEDILRAARYAIEATGGRTDAIDLYAEGEIGVAALHAAFLEPDLFKHIQLKNSLTSWESILVQERSYHQLANAVQGVLLHYDLPQLEEELIGQLEVTLPLDSLGYEDLPEGAPLPSDFAVPNISGLVGTFFGNASFLNPQGEYPLDELSVDYDNTLEKKGNDWSGIWKGFIIGPATGPVTFTGETDQALSISVDGKPVLKFKEFSGVKKSVIAMEKGELYPVEVRYQLPSGGKGNFSIKWSWNARPPIIVFKESLRHSKAQEYEIQKNWR